MCAGLPRNLKRFVSSSVVCRQRVFKKRDQTLEGWTQSRFNQCRGPHFRDVFEFGMFVFPSFSSCQFMSLVLAFPRMKPANWLNPIFAWELILVFPFATCHCDLDIFGSRCWCRSYQILGTLETCSVANWRYSWSFEFGWFILACVDHFRTRLDQSMAKKANAAAEGLCKFVFWTAMRCAFKSHLTHVTVTSCHLWANCNRGWSHGDVPWSFQDCEAKDGLFEGAKSWPKIR